MKAALNVLQGGLCTTVQDFGRHGFQAAGIPVSGALDWMSLAIANHLVGNAAGEGALEILIAGPDFEVEAESVRIALAGTTASIEILGHGGATHPPSRSVTLRRGQSFRIGKLPDSACAYLAVEGGFDLPRCLGSLSTYLRGGIGGLNGRPLMPGGRLPLNSEAAGDRVEVEIDPPPAPNQAEPVRVVLGPQDDLFTAKAMETLLSADYVISPKSDRMGLRLDGPALEHRGGADIVSDGTAPGSIQVPGNGLPIVLVADRGTTGGYPKIATVISADIPALGRRRAGQGLRFAAVDVTSAESIRRAQGRALRSLLAGVRPAPVIASLSMRALYDQNLISGIVDAEDRRD
jgi:biotin-dependent carboxylase-like uncharacterized protein